MGNDGRDIQALAHPVREEIADMLTDRELTPAEIRGNLPAEPTLSTVAYHLAILERAAVVERLGGVCRLA